MILFHQHHLVDLCEVAGLDAVQVDTAGQIGGIEVDRVHTGRSGSTNEVPEKKTRVRSAMVPGSLSLGSNWL